MKKLSEDLQDLADHVADAEKKAETAEQQTKDKVKADTPEIKSGCPGQAGSVQGQGQRAAGGHGMQWQEIQQDYHNRVQQIKNKIETEKEVREIKKARSGQKMPSDTLRLRSILR